MPKAKKITRFHAGWKKLKQHVRAQYPHEGTDEEKCVFLKNALSKSKPSVWGHSFIKSRLKHELRYGDLAEEYLDELLTCWFKIYPERIEKTEGRKSVSMERLHSFALVMRKNHFLEIHQV